MEMLIKMWGRTSACHDGVLFVEEIDPVSGKRTIRRGSDAEVICVKVVFIRQTLPEFVGTEGGTKHSRIGRIERRV